MEVSNLFFQITNDKPGLIDFRIFLRSVNDAVKNYQNYCPKKPSQRDLKTCVEQALSEVMKKQAGGSDFNGQNANSGSPNQNRRSQSQKKSRNYCEMRAQCMNNNNNAMTDSCESEFRQRAVPQLCTCSQDMTYRGRLRAYEADFLSCMNSQNVRANTTNDPAFKWLENGLNAW